MAHVGTSKTIGQIIEDRRLELGLTKAAAAKKAGVSRGTWHEVEGDQRAKTLAGTLALFENALELPRGELRRRMAGEDSAILEQPQDLVLHLRSKESPESVVITGSELARQRLVSYAYDLDVMGVVEVLRFIEEGRTPGNERLLVVELKQVVDDMAKVRAALDAIEDRLRENDEHDRRRPKKRQAKPPAGDRRTADQVVGGGVPGE